MAAIYRIVLDRRLTSLNLGPASRRPLEDRAHRQPGVCGNTLALPIEDTNDPVLAIIEGEVLGTKKTEARARDSSPMPGSWNHIVAWLKQIDAVRQAA